MTWVAIKEFACVYAGDTIVIARGERVHDDDHELLRRFPEMFRREDDTTRSVERSKPVTRGPEHVKQRRNHVQHDARVRRETCRDVDYSLPDARDECMLRIMRDVQDEHEAEMQAMYTRWQREDAVDNDIYRDPLSEWAQAQADFENRAYEAACGRGLSDYQRAQVGFACERV